MNSTERSRQYYLLNKEKIKAKVKEYQLKNQESIKTQRAAHYLENREKHLANSKKWHQANPEKVQAARQRYKTKYPERYKASQRKYDLRPEVKEATNKRGAQWHRDNPERTLARVREYQADKINATPSWADRRYMELFYIFAKEEEQRLGVPVHVDHIIPLRHKLVCGLHNEFNLQLLTATDNHIKNNHFEVT